MQGKWYVSAAGEISRSLEHHDSGLLLGSIQVERLDQPEPQRRGVYNTATDGEEEFTAFGTNLGSLIRPWAQDTGTCPSCYMQRSINGRCNCDA
jgi:hypothetical protein